MHHALNLVHKLAPSGARPMSPRSRCLEASPIMSPPVVAGHDGHDMEVDGSPTPTPGQLQHQQPPQPTPTQSQSLQLQHHQPPEQTPTQSQSLQLQHHQPPEQTPSQNLHLQHRQPTTSQNLRLRHQQPSQNLHLQYQQLPQPTQSQNLQLQHRQPSQATPRPSLQLRHQQPSPNLYLQYQQLPQPTPSQSLQPQHHQPPRLPPLFTQFRVERSLPLAPMVAGTHSSTTTATTTAVAPGETAGTGYSSQRRPLSVADLCSASPSSPIPDETKAKTAPEPTQTSRPTPKPSFPCIFAFAGCDSTFNGKRQWKRHVRMHHILPEYWVCRLDACLYVKSPVLVAVEEAATAARLPLDMGRYCRLAPRFNMRAANPVAATPPAYSISAVTRLAARGSLFNRMDIFKHHVSRAHFPPESWPDEQWWSDAVSSAKRERCRLPKNLPCPTVGCPAAFADFDTWMEHLGVHLQMSMDQTDSIMAGINGETDHPLITWAASSDVAIIARFDRRWVLSHTALPAGEGGNISARSGIASRGRIIYHKQTVYYR